MFSGNLPRGEPAGNIRISESRMPTNISNVNITVKSDTVSNSVGVCYFDPIEEVLLELGAVNNVITVEAGAMIVKKYYIVTNTSKVDVINVRAARGGGTDPSSLYDIKMLSMDSMPTQDDFDKVGLFNTVRIISPQPETFFPLWIMIKPKDIVNSLFALELEVEYE